MIGRTAERRPASMKRIFSFLSIFGSLTASICFAAPTPQRIEVQPGGSFQHKVIVFYGADGKESKRITLTGTIGLKNKSVDALVSGDGSHVVTSEQERDLNEHNPYTVRASSSVSMILYDASGQKLCATQTRAIPRQISGNGRVIAATDSGFDPESFDTMNTVPDLHSTDDLKEDASLTNSYLYLLNDSCQVTYSTTSVKTGWQNIFLSPSGHWLLFEEVESGVFTSGVGWKFFLTAVNSQNGQSWKLEWPRDIEPKKITDAGAVIGRKYLGQGDITSNEFMGTDGKKHLAHKRRSQYYEWKPGATGFQMQGTEVEEEK
jgi:hypothetical protein